MLIYGYPLTEERRGEAGNAMEINDSSVASMCAAIGDRLHSVFGALDEVRRQTEATLLHATRERRAQRSDIAELGDLLRTTLTDHEDEIDGIGIATTTGYLADSRHWIEWWRFDRRRHLEFVAHSLNPSRDVFYDYSALDWFTRPLASKATSITGPYVDFGGTNTSTVTLAMPVSVGGECIAVAGADIHTARFESYLTTENAEFEGERLPTILVNSDDRVIASNSADHLPGDLLDRAKIDADWTSFPVDTRTPVGSSWAILVPIDRNFKL